MKFDFKKFLSRKFIIAIIGTVVGLAMYFGVDASEIQKVAGAIVSAISSMSYIFGEAMVDVAAVKKKQEESEEPVTIPEKDDYGTDWK